MDALSKATPLKRQIAKLFRDGNQPDPDEHPDDAVIRVKALAYAKEHGEAFVREHAAELAMLVTVYADASAEDMLDALREHFWLDGGGG